VAALTCTPWCTSDDLPEAQQDADGAEEACQAASDILYAASGRRWRGECDRSVILELAPPVRRSWGDIRRAVLGSGRPIGPGIRWQVKLTDYPVREVSAVAEQRDPDGEPPTALAEGEWRLVNGRWLERLTDGARVPWSVCEIALEYTYGADPPAGGVRAAAEYATQMLLSWAGDGACQLPKRVQTITRQNVSMTFLDPGDYLDKGRTGVPSVDQWLASLNPSGLRRRPSVWSPDTDRTTPRYRTPDGSEEPP
jgi:hypothetical protein